MSFDFSQQLNKENSKKRASQILYLLAAIRLIIPFLLHHSYYQLHRDEYLYLAEGKHLDWGYLDVPPLLSVFTWVSNHLGGGFFWVKIWPNLFGSLTFLLVGKAVLRLGGGVFALVLAWLPFAIGGLVRLFFLVMPNYLDVFFWTLMAYSIFCYIQTSKNQYLYWFGLAVGLGMMSKYSSAFYTVSLLLGLLISRHRKVYLNKHFYLAGLLAFIIFLPNLLWQYNHAFPIINHMSELQEEQLQFINPADFLKAQLMMNLQFVYIWMAGLLFVVFSNTGKPYRVFGWAYAGVIILLVVGSGKDYYALGSYPVLFALGAVWLEQLTANKKQWVRYPMLVYTLALCALGMPFVMPFSRPERLAAFYKKMGFEQAGSLRWEDQQFHPLPQDFADMMGWREMTEQAAKIYHQIPQQDRDSTMIYARGYYTAGALNYYGPQYGLPEVYSDNANFLFWMPEKYHIKNLLLVGHHLPDSDDKVFQQFQHTWLVDSVNMPLFREHGMKFILFANANDSANRLIEESVQSQKAKFQRK